MEANRNRFDTFDQEISAQVRAEIARARRTRKEIAEAIGMHENVFLRKCNGESAFTSGELARVAHAIGITAGLISENAESRFLADRGRGVA